MGVAMVWAAVVGAVAPVAEPVAVSVGQWGQVSHLIPRNGGLQFRVNLDGGLSNIDGNGFHQTQMKGIARAAAKDPDDLVIVITIDPAMKGAAGHMAAMVRLAREGVPAGGRVSLVFVLIRPEKSAAPDPMARTPVAPAGPK